MFWFLILSLFEIAPNFQLAFNFKNLFKFHNCAKAQNKQTNNVELAAEFRENCETKPNQPQIQDTHTMQETDSQNRPAGHTSNDMG